MQLKPHICIIGYVWPQDCSSAAGFRTQNLMDCFKQNGWKLSFISPEKSNSYRELLEAQAIETHVCQANDSNFDALICKLAPDVVIFDRFVIEEQFGWRVEENLPDTIRIIDTQDLHSLRRERARSFKKNNNLEENIELTNNVDRLNFQQADCYREIASLLRSDLNLIISKFEYKLLQEKFSLPAQLLHYFPFCYEGNHGSTKTFQEREHFCFLGNFRHPPNYDAVLWLCQAIWPEIRRNLPSAQFHLYGAYPQKEISQLHNPKLGIHFFGPTDNLAQTLSSYRVMLAPLRFGAGLKGKISDSWQYGLPVVSTAIGHEAMHDDSDQWGGIMANTNSAIIAAAEKLYTDTFVWLEAQSNGFRLLNKCFHREEHFPNLTTRILNLLKNVTIERDQNFMGSMLKEHQFRSTKYFSRWLELKNSPDNLQGNSPS